MRRGIQSAPEDLPQFANYNKEKAKPSTAVCTPNIDQQKTTGTKVGIAVGSFIAAAAAFGIYHQQQKKKRLAAEKMMADEELDRTKDELELGSNMMQNPMQSSRNLNNTSLIQKGKEADAEIMKLRDEVRRLRYSASARKLAIELARDDSKMPSSRSRKKEFGQTP